MPSVKDPKTNFGKHCRGIKKMAPTRQLKDRFRFMFDEPGVVTIQRILEFSAIISRVLELDVDILYEMAKLN